MAGSQTIKHTVKYTFADRRTLIADMPLMGGAIRQRCASCHFTAISYVYSARKMSSFFRMSYCLNALIFGNISSVCGSAEGVLRDTQVQNCMYIFWSILKVYTIRYFSIAKLFLIALLRNNYLSLKCIGD